MAPGASETCRNAGGKSGRDRCCRNSSCSHTRFILWLRPQFELQRLSAGELHHAHTHTTPWKLLQDWMNSSQIKPNCNWLKMRLKKKKKRKLKHHIVLDDFHMWRTEKKRKKEKKRTLNCIYSTKSHSFYDTVGSWLVRSATNGSSIQTLIGKSGRGSTSRLICVRRGWSVVSSQES